MFGLTDADAERSFNGNVSSRVGMKAYGNDAHDGALDFGPEEGPRQRAGASDESPPVRRRPSLCVAS
jgi:hypothetical protein